MLSIVTTTDPLQPNDHPPDLGLGNLLQPIYFGVPHLEGVPFRYYQRWDGLGNVCGRGQVRYGNGMGNRRGFQRLEARRKSCSAGIEMLRAGLND
jgi:hypothetical protein